MMKKKNNNKVLVLLCGQLKHFCNHKIRLIATVRKEKAAVEFNVWTLRDLKTLNKQVLGLKRSISELEKTNKRK